MTTKKAPSLKAIAESVKGGAGTVSKSVPTFDVDPRSIQVRPGFNMRPVDMGHVAQMRESMLGGAVFQPLWVVVEDGNIYLLDGEHRLTAYLGLPTVPTRVKVMEFKGNMAQQILFMMGCAKGKAALPLQVGTQFALLVNTYGMSYEEIAKADGVSVQHVKDMIRLTQQEPEITGMIKDGTVTATTALKLVKQVGSKEAAATLKKAATVAKADGKKVTQKVIDKVAEAPKGITAKDKANAGKSMVAAVTNRSDIVKDHLRSMLESPTITGPNRDHVKAVLAMCEGKTPVAPAETLTAKHFIEHHLASPNEAISAAAGVMNSVLTGKTERIPQSGSPEAQDYGHRRWLEQMAMGTRGERKELKHAAHWFTAVLNNHARKELAPPPQVMGLEDAIRAEIDSGGAAKAADLCPEAVDCINYLRGE